MKKNFFCWIFLKLPLKGHLLKKFKKIFFIFAPVGWQEQSILAPNVSYRRCLARWNVEGKRRQEKIYENLNKFLFIRNIETTTCRISVYGMEKKHEGKIFIRLLGAPLLKPMIAKDL